MEARPRARTEGILWERVDDELLIYNSESTTAHCLSAEAASIWELCDGSRSPTEIAAQLGIASDHVPQALDQLADAGLLASGRASASGVSRREVTKRFAQFGAAALSASMVYSIAVPTAAAAQSNPCAGMPDGTLCGKGQECEDQVCVQRPV